MADNGSILFKQAWKQGNKPLKDVGYIYFERLYVFFSALMSESRLLPSLLWSLENLGKT